MILAEEKIVSQGWASKAETDAWRQEAEEEVNSTVDKVRREPAPDPDPDPVPAFPIPDDIAIPDPCWFNPECGPIDPGDPGDDTPDGDVTPETTPDTPDTPDGDSPSTDSSVQTAAPAVVVNASPNFTG